MTFYSFSCIISIILFTISFNLAKKRSTPVNGFEKAGIRDPGNDEQALWQ